jgi:biopolymer transport protein ExbD
MAGTRAEDSEGPITGINVTPLVDVVLVLLIIFMATAPLIHRRALQVNVPKAAHSEAKATAALQVQMNAAREIYADKDRVDRGRLEGLLRERLALEPSLHVSVAADETIPYGEVVDLLDVVRGAGVKKVALEVRTKR